MDGNLATTYSLIYAFLVKNAHTKVAEALKKSVKDIVILKGDVVPRGPSLDRIVQEWRKFFSETKKSPPSASNSDSSDSSESDASSGDSSSDSSSSDSSSNDSDSSEDSDSSDSSSSDDDSSSSSSSESNRSLPTNRDQKPQPKVSIKTKVIVEPSSSSSDSSDSDSSSSSSSSSDSSDPESSSSASDSGNKSRIQRTLSQKKQTNGSTPKAERQSSDTLSSGNVTDNNAQAKTSGTSKVRKPKNTTKESAKFKDDSSFVSSNLSTAGGGGEKQSRGSKALKAKKIVSQQPSELPIKTEGQKEEPAGDVQTAKKRRISKSGAAVVTATTGVTKPEPNTMSIVENTKQDGRKNNTPFQRVNPDKVPQHFIQDNAYVSKAGPANDYGQRAHQDLIVTRGAGFRKEKNKKKRGSYKGGAITMESHSFKFKFDD